MTDHYPFQNPPLPYAYNALEPFIDEKTMHLHHDRHLQTYVDNLNKALQNEPTLQTLPLEQLICNVYGLPSEVQTAIHNNAGGVYNHIFYFEGMHPGPQAPSGGLLQQINRSFGSVEAFQKQMKEAALSVFGSGYAWLVSDRMGGLKIVTTANQDTPLCSNLCPILNLDVWEHAYYLKHYNLRADYIDDWFRVVNWDQANKRYQNCEKKKYWELFEFQMV